MPDETNANEQNTEVMHDSIAPSAHFLNHV